MLSDAVQFEHLDALRGYVGKRVNIFSEQKYDLTHILHSIILIKCFFFSCLEKNEPLF